MTQISWILSGFFLAACALMTLACGDSSSHQNRVLQSIAITPADADAQLFPNRQVQFVATGTFSMPPSPQALDFQAPYSGSWVLTGDNSSSIATLSTTGLAQCLEGASGVVTVEAGASSGAGMGSQATDPLVAGMTTLTCP
jgi:hypothetical protein